MALQRDVLGSSRSRHAPLDWIRGLAIILVLLSHGWALWSTASLAPYPALLNLVSSGNLGVTVFLVVAGFLLTRSLIGSRGVTEDDRGEVGTIAADRPALAVLTRAVRIAAQVFPLLAVILVVALVDPHEVLRLEYTGRTIVAVATSTWNIYLQSSSLIARPDLGHLWYTSVYLQVTVVIVILVRTLRHRRRVLVAVVAALLLASTAWRAHVVETEGAYLALLRTTTRMDGMLWGSLVALLWPWFTPLRRGARDMVAVCLLGLAVLSLTLGNSTAYLGWAGVAANACTAGFVGAAPWLDRSGALSRFVSGRSLAFLGRHSLSVYVWHYPIFFLTARDVPTWPSWLKVAFAAATLAAFAVLTTRYVERPVTNVMRRLLAASKNRNDGPADDLVEAPDLTGAGGWRP